jgi:hypothetical protein
MLARNEYRRRRPHWFLALPSGLGIIPHNFRQDQEPLIGDNYFCPPRVASSENVTSAAATIRPPGTPPAASMKDIGHVRYAPFLKSSSRENRTVEKTSVNLRDCM